MHCSSPVPHWSGLSRLHLRAHHASDVVGGAVIGTAIGLIGRRLLVTGAEEWITEPGGCTVMTPSQTFAVTWDYRCPFARNGHEHILDALEAGAPWEVTFVPFFLNQAHVAEGGTPAWEDPAQQPDLLSLAAGVVVRDRFPEQFLAVHRALFAARHDRGRRSPGSHRGA